MTATDIATVGMAVAGIATVGISAVALLLWHRCHGRRHHGHRHCGHCHYGIPMMGSSGAAGGPWPLRVLTLGRGNVTAVPTPGTLPCSHQAPAVPCPTARHRRTTQVPTGSPHEGALGRCAHSPGGHQHPALTRLRPWREVACAFPGAFLEPWVFLNRKLVSWCQRRGQCHGARVGVPAPHLTCATSWPASAVPAGAASGGCRPAQRVVPALGQQDGPHRARSTPGCCISWGGLSGR